jgi:phasin family protein
VIALTADGRSALARQQEILADAMRETKELIMEFRPSGSPDEIAKKNAELTRRAFEAMVKNTRDVLELTQKSGGDARVIIVNRMREKLYQGPLANRTQE